MNKEFRPRLNQTEWDIIQNHRREPSIILKQNLPDHFKSVPKILMLDIETLPMEVLVWGLYKQRIPHTNIIKDWSIVSWAAKWLYDAEVMSDVLTPEEAIAKNDFGIMSSLWKVMEQADIICAHNGIRFDIRKINARFWFHKIPPPAPYQIIDTLKESQKTIGLSSHRLDYISQLISKKGKLDTDFDLWKRCMIGEQEALTYMSTYNKEDVLLLEECYLSIRPFIKNHPNLFIHGESTEKCCVYCGSTELSQTTSSYVTPAGSFQVFRCAKCGGLNRERFSELTKEDKAKLLISVAH
jgi:DNA polymerase elongation subunit (family B)